MQIFKEKVTEFILASKQDSGRYSPPTMCLTDLQPQNARKEEGEKEKIAPFTLPQGFADEAAKNDNKALHKTVHCERKKPRKKIGTMKVIVRINGCLRETNWFIDHWNRY